MRLLGVILLCGFVPSALLADEPTPVVVAPAPSSSSPPSWGDMLSPSPPPPHPSGSASATVVPGSAEQVNEEDIPTIARTNHVGDSLGAVAWDVSYPVGSMNGYVSTVTGQGLEFEGRRFVHPRLSLGIGAGWDLFTQTRDPETFELPNGALHARLYRNVEVFALRGSAHFYGIQRGPIMPFIGVQMGASIVTYQVSAVDITSASSAWNFALSPEIGVLFMRQERRQSMGVIVSFRYTWIPMTFEPIVSDTQFIGVQLGVFFLR